MTLRARFCYFWLVVVLFAPPLPAVSAPAAAPEWTAAEKVDLARAEDYLNSIKTLRSPFVQAHQDGTLLRGTISLSRPGRMRLDYEPPMKDFLVADGLFVHHWDDLMQQSSSAPLGSTLADLILRDPVTLSGDITITAITRLTGTLEISLIQTGDAAKGNLTLVLEDKPLRLRKWRVVDAQGLTTEVALLNPQFGVNLDKNLFFYKDPNFNKKRD